MHVRCLLLVQRASSGSVLQGKRDTALFSETSVLAHELGNADMEMPKRRQDVNLKPFSTVLSQPLMCYPNAPVDFELITIPHRGASHQERAVSVAPAQPS